MLISEVTSYSTNGVTAANLTPVNRTYQAPQTSKLSAPKLYSVKLSGEALAKSMMLQGYSAVMISIKMGLDIKTVDQYLGIAVPTTNTTTKSTYTQPKASNTNTKALK